MALPAAAHHLRTSLMTIRIAITYATHRHIGGAFYSSCKEVEWETSPGSPKNAHYGDGDYDACYDRGSQQHRAMGTPTTGETTADTD